jgi:hypothetical protein
MKPPTLRATLATLILAGMLIGGFQPEFLRIFTRDRARIRAYFSELPYRKLPGLQRFMAMVKASTAPGAVIAVMIERRSWDGGYEYGYNRAVYLLGGRNVVAVLDAENRFHVEELAQAQYLACWRCTPPEGSPFHVIARTDDGTLAVRR